MRLEENQEPGVLEAKCIEEKMSSCSRCRWNKTQTSFFDLSLLPTLLVQNFPLAAPRSSHPVLHLNRSVVATQQTCLVCAVLSAVTRLPLT